MKYLKVILFFISIFLIDQILLSFFPNFQITLFIPVVVFGSMVLSLNNSLILALVVGLLYDSSLLQKVPLMTLYLLLVVCLIFYLRRKIIHHQNELAMYLIAVVTQSVYLLISTFYFNYSLTYSYLILHFLLNAILTLIVAVLFHYIFKKFIHEVL